MHFFKSFLYLFLVLGMSISLRTQATTEDRANELSRYQITEAKLKNGLRVCLKKSDLEPKEFDFQLFAIGGIAQLPAIDRPSGWLAGDIAWESGLNELNADELECALDDHSLEMNIKLGLFDRKIMAAGPTAELAYSLELVRLLFTNPQFNEAGLRQAIAQVRERFQKQEQACQIADEQTALKINLRNWYYTAPFNSLDLGKVELEKAKAIFKTFFFNPAEFTIVIVGDFDPKPVLAILEESLGSLPFYPVTQWPQPNPPSFPDGMTKKEFTGVARYRDSLTRLTFPLSSQAIDPTALDLLCFILKKGLTSEAILSEFKTNCFNISYAFPLFPYLHPCWLVIKFSSPAHQIQPICQCILKKMEKITVKAISEDEIKWAYQELGKKRAQASDNAYMLSLLADSYRAGWDITQLYALPSQEQEADILKKIIASYPFLNQYSIISFHP